MNFKLTHRKVDGVAVINMSGRLILGEESSTLHLTIEELLNAGEKNILLNLADGTAIDTSGRGVLVGGRTSATMANAQIKLANLDRKVHDVIRITRLHMVFEVLDDEQQAIRSFAGAPRHSAAASMTIAPPSNGKTGACGGAAEMN